MNEEIKMKKEIKILSRKLIWTIAGLTLIINIIAGICNYIFVTRHQAELDKKQIEKIEKELNSLPKKDKLQIKYFEKSIERIEKDIAKIDSRSEKILERLSIDEKKKRISVMDRETIRDIQPALYRIVNMNYISPSEIKFTYEIKNIGKYPVNIIRRLYLATTEIISPDKINRKLIRGKDYQLSPHRDLSKDKFGINHLTPGEDINGTIIIKLLKPNIIPNTIFYYIVIDAETDDNIIKSLNKYNLTKTEINKIKSKYYTSQGSIVKIK